jgi:hypothetical protein
VRIQRQGLLRVASAFESLWIVALTKIAMIALACWLVGCSSDDEARPHEAIDASTPDADAASDGSADADAAVQPDADAQAEAEASLDAGGFAPGPKTLLSDNNPNDLDEDPSVRAAADGSLIIAYFSSRNGNPDLYLRRTFDGVTWTETRITTSPAADYYPSLSQDETGRFHLAWFRWTAFQVGSVWYNSTLDPTSWDPSNEEQVTTAANVDDWVPSLAKTASGDLLIAFASEKRNPASHSELYLSKKPAGQSAWLAALPIAALESATEDDTLPVLTRTGATLTLDWVRCAPGGTPPCLSGSADLYRASSNDGATWSAPETLTSDAADTTADTLPSSYFDSQGTGWLLWVSAPAGTNGAVVEAPLLGSAASPVSRPELEGYSPHVAATPTPGVYLGAWVEQVDSDPNHKDVFYRFFAK